MAKSRSYPSLPGSRGTALGLFAGVGGIELGLGAAGFEALGLCEIDPGAQRVLRTHFVGVPITPDVRDIRSLPRVDVLAAGFPCQDLSQAGGTAGIGGKKSGVVSEVFRLLRTAKRAPRWLLLENVPFMLQLEGGRAMRVLVDQLEDLGFAWAYRVIDAQAFGVPQRRRRVILVASRTEDPRPVLLGPEHGEPQPHDTEGSAYGFYWTEGLRGLGWAVDALPTLKGGSTVGIPSPPALWTPSTRDFSTPDIRDAERLQGFSAGWTEPAVGDSIRPGARWRLVGNAVNVRMASWVGERLASGDGVTRLPETRLESGGRWPVAAWGAKGQTFAVDRSAWPTAEPSEPLLDFLRFPTKPLSARAAAGFLARLSRSTLSHPQQFRRDLERHVRRLRPAAGAGTGTSRRPVLSVAVR